MQRIADANAVPARPATPSLAGLVTGFFTNGTPGIQAPTVVPDWWLNMTQEELCALLTAVGLPLDGSATVLQAIRLIPPGRLINRRVFYSNGTYVPTSGTNAVFVQIVGGGSSGASTQPTGAGQVAAAPGGGAGGYAEKWITSGFAGALITLGGGGPSPPAGANGYSGGTTSFGTILSATGGYPPNVGTAGPANSLPVGGAQGGNGVGGDINSRGGPASYALYTNPATGSSGGASYFGAGGAGVTGSGNGSSATSPGGGGGGGAQSVSSAGAAIGGAGGQGVVVVWEFT